MGTRTQPRLTVVGGKQGRSQWHFLDDDLQMQGFRIYLVEDAQTGERFWATDFKIRGILPKEYTCISIEGVAADETGRARAYERAKTLLRDVPIPSPAKEVSVLE